MDIKKPCPFLIFDPKFLQKLFFSFFKYQKYLGAVLVDLSSQNNDWLIEGLSKDESKIVKKHLKSIVKTSQEANKFSTNFLKELENSGRNPSSEQWQLNKDRFGKKVEEIKSLCNEALSQLQKYL